MPRSPESEGIQRANDVFIPVYDEATVPGFPEGTRLTLPPDLPEGTIICAVVLNKSFQSWQLVEWREGEALVRPQEKRI